MTIPARAGDEVLLPCPFCGGEAEWREVHSLNEHDIRCRACRLSLEQDSHAAALAAWNTRQALARPAAGYAEGVEAAAKVAERHIHSDCECKQCMTVVSIRAQIRALAAVPPGPMAEVELSTCPVCKSALCEHEPKDEDNYEMWTFECGARIIDRDGELDSEGYCKRALWVAIKRIAALRAADVPKGEK